jgi:alpha-glucosidase
MRVRCGLLVGVVAGLLCAATHLAGAQTLAQRNWAGSGVTVEPWWKRAVFYRIDPARFQASDAASVGDLAGIAERLDYIQSLGVDAIVLTTALTPNAPGWSELERAAAERHVRVLVTLPAPESQAAAADAKVVALARAWLTQGVAGVWVPTQAIAKVDGGEHIAALLRQLRALTNSFPGERVLLADTAPANAEAALTHGLAVSVQLTASAPIRLATPTAASLRAQMTSALGAADKTALVSVEREPVLSNAAQQAALERTVAALLLGSRAAVVLDYGEELGLLRSANADGPPLMQWTPNNRTRKPEPPAETKKVEAAAAKGDDYGAFKPYVPPLPRNFFPPPPMPFVVAVEHPVNPRIDPDAMQGFTSGDVPAAGTVNGKTANVALEDSDPASLLAFYRRLIQMHHEDVTLKSGLQTFVDRDADDALVWLRQAPASSRTVGNALVVCNLSAKPLTISLDALHLRGTNLRTLLGDAPQRSASGLTVAGGAVFLGEAAR